MGPNGVFKYIWYLDLFGVVFFLEVLEPLCFQAILYWPLPPTPYTCQLASAPPLRQQ